MIYLFWLLVFPTAQTPTLKAAKITFEATHMGVLKVEGTFDELKGEVQQVGKGEWLIIGEVTVASLDTDNDSRDETILTEQYLDAENHPTIPFEARLVRREGQFSVTIDLMLRGIAFQLSGEMLVDDGMLISAPITFSRSEIGLDFGLMDSLIGDEITFMINTGIASSTFEQ